jgi:beta-glucosidase
VRYAKGCDVSGDDTRGFAEATQAAKESDVVVAVMGDLAGLFGRGTSGEGCDVDSLELPGVQRRLVERLLDTGKPVVLVLLTGRPYVLDWAVERCAAVVQAFFPGQEGARAVAGVLSGRVNPSGHLPVSLPRSVGAQPYSYLHPPLGGASSVSNLDTAPVLPFGHGLSYTTFDYSDLVVHDAQVDTDGSFRASVRVTNTGDRDGADVVQLYGHDPVASVTRPVVQLLGYARVDLAAGRSAEVTFEVPAARLAFTDRSMARVVEPGEWEISVRQNCQDAACATQTISLVGPVHPVSVDDARMVGVTVEHVPG